MNEITPEAELAEEPTTPVIDPQEVETVETETARSPQVDNRKPEKKEEYSRRAQKTINKQRWELGEEQRKNSDLQNRIKALEEANRLKAEPDPDDYNDHSKLQEDQQKWKEQETARITKEAEERVYKKINSQNIQRNTETQMDTYYEMKEKARENDDKYDSYEQRIDAVINANGASDIHDAIISSKTHSTEIVTYLGKHPEELEAIGQLLTPSERILAIGKIAGKVESKPVKQKSDAPAPPSPMANGSAHSSSRNGGQSIEQIAKNRRAETPEQRRNRINKR